MEIKNGYMRCDTRKKIDGQYPCRIKCYENYRPENKHFFEPTCVEGSFFPDKPSKNEEWKCIKGECKESTFGHSCWGVKDPLDDQFTQYLHTLGVYQHGSHKHPYGRKRREDAEGEIGRYHNNYHKHTVNHVINLTSRCDNCNGLWQNQVHCVFNTRCLDVPPVINNAYVECQRVGVDTNKNDKHVCMVQCHDNYQIVKNSCRILPKVPGGEGDKGKNNKKGRKRREEDVDEEVDAGSERGYGHSHGGNYGHSHGGNYGHSHYKPDGHHHAPVNTVTVTADHSHNGHANYNYAESHSSHTLEKEVTVETATSTHSETHIHHVDNTPEAVHHHHHVQVVGLVHKEEIVVKGPSPPGTMSCDARTGDWDQWCRCEWKLKCETPSKPNSKYECWEEDGLTICQLTCKGNGQFVPAKWRDQWQFKCKRGIWIEREPQGCVYEPPCKVPDLPNALITGCKKQKCMAPLRAYREMMPGQRNYKKNKPYSGPDSHSMGSNLPHTHGHSHGHHHGHHHGRKRRSHAETSYHGRTRRQTEEENPDGTVTLNENGDYMEFFYSSDGTPVFNPINEVADGTVAEGDSYDLPEPELIDYEYESESRGIGRTQDEDDEAFRGGKHNKKKNKHVYTGFGTCMARRQVAGGYIHCHSIGAYHPVHGHEHINAYGSGGYGGQAGGLNYNKQYGGHYHGHNGGYHISASDTSGGHTHKGHVHRGEFDQCRTRHNVQNGWMECRNGDKGWVCRIRCNKGMRPSSRNQFTRCEGGEMKIPMQCVKGRANRPERDSLENRNFSF